MERDYTERPTIELEERFYNLTEALVRDYLSDERKKQIGHEIAHIVFELNSRVNDEAGISV